jgi:hypothetical protein
MRLFSNDDAPSTGDPVTDWLMNQWETGAPVASLGGAIVVAWLLGLISVGILHGLDKIL